MKNAAYIIAALVLYASVNLFAQETTETADTIAKVKAVEKVRGFFAKKNYKFNYNSFTKFIPLRDNPTMGWRSSLTDYETIMFDVHPILGLNIFNDFQSKFSQNAFFGQNYYFTFRPQFRMFAEQSTPVQMPSYRFFLGLQHIYRINENNYVGYSLESGHYSNGQEGSPVKGTDQRDGTPESDSLLNLITDTTDLSAIINREDGDFSTNLSEVIFNWRHLPSPKEGAKGKQVHSTSFGIVLYHNNFFGIVDMGGYSEQAIEIYGQWRFLISYEYTYYWKTGYRIAVSENIEAIQGAHPHVNPIRTMTSASLYLRNNIGLVLSYIYGHDDYNLRFVDSGHQIGVGLTWDMYAPILMNGKKHRPRKKSDQL